MRRSAFYFTVGLISFFLGFAASVSFSSDEAVNSQSVEQMKQFILSQKEFARVERQPEILHKKERFTCTDDTIKPAWEKLKREDAEWTDYMINESPVTDCAELFEKKVVRLNSEAEGDVFLRGKETMCGSGADCHTWIISKINNKYRIILELYASEFDDVIVSPEKKNKYFNVEIKQNNHRTADTYGFFKFDGKKYRVKKCVEDANSDELNNPSYLYDAKNGNKKLIRVSPKNCL